MNKFGMVISAILLSACASQIPEQTRNAPSHGSTDAGARFGTHRFNGEHVRWGGTIAAVEHRGSRTWIEVNRCHLSNSGTPQESHRDGQFIARVEGKLDPAIYSKGQRLTVVGDLEDAHSGAADQYGYGHPVVNVTTHHLWGSPNGRDELGIALGANSKLPVARVPLFFGIFY